MSSLRLAGETNEALDNTAVDSRLKWIQPSGPRTSGQGVEDEQQGIIEVTPTANGAVLLRVTLLAAGFVIGHHGTCIRQIGKLSGAAIKSWTDQPSMPANTHRACRNFLIQGEQKAVERALEIMYDALTRYKQLCEGGLRGQCVSQVQNIHGIQFMYMPPPRNAVPQAAALSGPQQRTWVQSNDGHERGKQAQHILADIKQAIAAQLSTTNHSPDAASCIPAHPPAFSARIASAQVQALPPAAASVGHCDSYLQTTATLKPGWLTSLQSQQRPDGFLHQAQAAALHTHIPPAISPAPHTLHPAAPESLNCMQQPRKHSRMFIDSKESAQSAQAGHEHTTFSWKDYNHYLQAAAMQAAMSSKQSGPVPAVLDQTQFRQHAAVPAAVTRRTHYQQQQLQAAAVAALYNAAHLHPEMLQPHFSTHAAESRSSQLTSAASVQNIRGRSAQTHQGHHHHDAALVAQQQTVYAPEVSALEHALGMHFMPQARPNQMRGTNPALMEHQPMPHSQYPTQFSAVSYDNLAGCPNDFLHRKQNTSLQSRQDAFLQAAYAQGRLGSNQLTRRDL